MNNMFEEGYTNRLKNQLFKILCLKDESNPIWEKQLDNLLIELNSFDDKNKAINYYALVNKVSMLRYLNHKYFRETIFDCMQLLGK